MADIFERVFETIYIYKSIVICKDQTDAIKVHDVLYDRDYAVTLDPHDTDNRMLVLNADTFCQLGHSDLNWQDYEVVFVSDQVREVIPKLDILENVKMIVIFNSSYE
jgi:hypothetical protein